MNILALDLGKFNTMCCFFDTATREYHFLSAVTDPNYLTSVFKSEKIDLVVMEACGPSGWINDLAVSLGLKSFVCSTNEKAWHTGRDQQAAAFDADFITDPTAGSVACVCYPCVPVSRYSPPRNQRDAEQARISAIQSQA